MRMTKSYTFLHRLSLSPKVEETSNRVNLTSILVSIALLLNQWLISATVAYLVEAVLLYGSVHSLVGE